jgi:hypothetical protein
MIVSQVRIDTRLVAHFGVVERADEGVVEDADVPSVRRPCRDAAGPSFGLVTARSAWWWCRSVGGRRPATDGKPGRRRGMTWIRQLQVTAFLTELARSADLSHDSLKNRRGIKP